MTSGVLLICISLYLALVVVVCIWTYCCIAMHSKLKSLERSKLGNQTVIYSDCSALLPEKCNFIAPLAFMKQFLSVLFFPFSNPLYNQWVFRVAIFMMWKASQIFYGKACWVFSTIKNFFYFTMNNNQNHKVFYLVGIFKKNHKTKQFFVTLFDINEDESNSLFYYYSFTQKPPYS